MIVLVRLDFFSPFFAYPFYMLHGRGPVAPPPSTLIGALAAVYYAPRERGDVSELAERVRYASFYVPSYVEVENPARHFTGYVQKKQRLNLLRQALAAERLDADLIRRLDANIRGVNAAKLRQLGMHDSAIKRAVAAAFMSPGTRREVYYSEPAYALYVLDAEVAHLPRHIYRLGQKETLVAATPVDVEIRKAELPINTRFYTPLEALGGACDGDVAYMAEKPFPSPDKARLKPYCLPRVGVGINVRLVERGWTAVRVVGDGVSLDAVLPEDAV